MANIILNRRRGLKVPGRKMLLEGRIGWELIHRSGVIVRKSDPKPNIITDAALNDIGATSNSNFLSRFNWCAVGTGNSAPAVGQTTLDAQLGTRTEANAGVGNAAAILEDAGVYRVEFDITRLFDFDNANGNLTEIGFFTASTAGVMFNRQLLKDDVGAPTTITKTSDYQLRVTLKVILHLDITATVLTGVAIGGGTYDISTRQVGMYNPHQFGTWMTTETDYRNTYLLEADAHPAGLSTALLAGISTTNTARSSGQEYQAYVAGSFERTLLAYWNAAVGNALTIRSWGHAPAWNTSTFGHAAIWFHHIFTPEIPKDDLHRLDLYATLRWGRTP